MVRNFARVLLYDEALKAKPALHHVIQLVFELYGKHVHEIRAQRDVLV
jgi:hypothetical protein